MAISIAREDETSGIRFNLVYQDPGEGEPEAAPERELEFTSEAEAEAWVNAGCIVPICLQRVERIYDRWGRLVFTYTDARIRSPERGY